MLLTLGKIADKNCRVQPVAVVKKIVHSILKGKNPFNLVWVLLNVHTRIRSNWLIYIEHFMPHSITISVNLTSCLWK